MRTFHDSAVQQTFKRIQNSLPLERIVEEHILPRQLEQHRVVEELVDGHILAKTLSSAGLDHEFSCQVGGRLRLKGSDDNALVQRITRNNLHQRIIVRVVQKLKYSIISLTCQWWNTERQNAWPRVCVLRSVSNPKESIAGMNALIM
jgi:hypothetical protein